MGSSALIGGGIMGSSGAKAQARAQQSAAERNSAAAIEVARIQADAAREAAGMQQTTALDVAQMQSDAALGAAGITANATLESTKMNLAAQDEAVKRFEQASAESIGLQEREFALAQERLDPFSEIGRDQIQAVNDAGTLEGFAQRLSDMANSDVYDELFSERMEVADARLAASGMNRSGAAAQEAAELSMSTILGLDSTLYGRQVNNVNFGRGVATEQNAIGSNFANAVGNLKTGTALNAGNLISNTAMANGQMAVNSAMAQGNFLTQGAAASGNALMAGTNAAAAGINNAAFQTGQGIMGSANALGQGQIGAANAIAQGRQNTFNNIMAAGQLAASFFSDPTMKENMEKVGEYGGLNVYEWDWKEEYKDEFGTEMNIGFNADEVEREYPQYVETRGRKKKINYDGLMAELQEAA